MRTELGLWNTPKNHLWKGESIEEKEMKEMKEMKELFFLKYTYQNLLLKNLDFLTKIRIRLEGWVEDYENLNKIIPMN